jgi:hypothetical protein
MVLDQQARSLGTLQKLRATIFREPAHVWLYEVNNGTGSFGNRQFADALVCSVYPSRGLWIAGLELKEHRGDWLRELDKPEKSATIQAYCHYWYVVAPEGIVHRDEIPKTWGFYEVGKKPVLKKRAPRLKPKPASIVFLLSVLRNASAAQSRVFAQGKEAGIEHVRGDSTNEDLRKERDELALRAKARDQVATNLEAELNGLKSRLSEFERLVGFNEGELIRGLSSWQVNTTAAHLRIARVLANMRETQLLELLRQFQSLATGLSELDETIKAFR